MSFLPSPTPYHFRSHPSQAEEERRPDDVCKPDAGTQKTWCRSRLILHSSVAMNSAHLGHQRKRHEYPTVARLAVSPKVFPLFKFPSFLKHIVYDELLTTDGLPHSNPAKRPPGTATSKMLPWSPLLPAPGTGQGLLRNPTAANCDLWRGSWDTLMAATLTTNYHLFRH